MIQVRDGIFETNSSSTHCFTVMKRDMYELWKNYKIALSIYYVYSSNDRSYELGTDIEPTINLPENFMSIEKAKTLSKEREDKYDHYYDYANLRFGDNGFMRNWGNFDTYAPIVRQIDIDKKKEENVKMLRYYISDERNSWYMQYLKEQNKYDDFVALIDDYEKTGQFTEEMYSKFPNFLFFDYNEYMTMLDYDECHSPFIHVYADIVAFGHYFHS